MSRLLPRSIQVGALFARAAGAAYYHHDGIALQGYHAIAPHPMIALVSPFDASIHLASDSCREDRSCGLGREPCAGACRVNPALAAPVASGQRLLFQRCDSAVSPGGYVHLEGGSGRSEMENVIALAFGDSQHARGAVRALQNLHRSGDIRLEDVAIVERIQDGRTIVLEHAESSQLQGAAGVVVIGAVIGLLTGPVGLLVGGASGAVIGSLVDHADAEGSEDLLRWLGRAVPRGHVATIAVVEETTPVAVDALASERGVIPLRRPRADVELEIAGAESQATGEAGGKDNSGAVGDRLVP